MSLVCEKEPTRQRSETRRAGGDLARRRSNVRWLAALVWLAASGCTLDPGNPFATLQPSIDARLDAPADRLLPGGWWRLSSDYEVRFLVAAIDLPSIDLVAVAGGALGFDPANPPPGYSLCHNGHCHHESGRLVPYEEIGAELSGRGNAPPPPAAALSVGRLDLIAGETRPIGCRRSCDLPLTRIGRLRGRVAGITLEGLVRDGRTPPRFEGERAWRATAIFAGSAGETAPELTGQIDLPSDRQHDPSIDLDILLRPGPALLDGVDWAAAQGDGAIDLTAPANAAAWRALRAALAEVPLGANIDRSPL